MPHPGAPFGPLDFQLVLLRRMADQQPGLVEDARHELGVPLAVMREANRRWQAMVRSPGPEAPHSATARCSASPRRPPAGRSAIWSATPSSGRCRSGRICGSRC